MKQSVHTFRRIVGAALALLVVLAVYVGAAAVLGYWKKRRDTDE